MYVSKLKLLHNIPESEPVRLTSDGLFINYNICYMMPTRSSERLLLKHVL
jgi:hypothetical protein